MMVVWETKINISLAFGLWKTVVNKRDLGSWKDFDQWTNEKRDRVHWVNFVASMVCSVVSRGEK